jgi:hypothetical protein
MTDVIKISLIWSGDDNVYECHRTLPVSYFEDCRCDFFTKELDNMRNELLSKNLSPEDYQEHVRIANINTDTGRVFPSRRDDND